MPEALRISIVIPNFNGAPYLGTCLDSIVSQRNADAEIVLMDGGSTDGSLDIARSYGAAISVLIAESDDANPTPSQGDRAFKR